MQDDMARLLAKYQPMTEAMYYVMLAFHQPLHGYGAMKFVNRITEGRVHISPGTLYGLIAKLTQESLIQPVNGPESLGGRRKRYTLSPLGRDLLGHEFKRITDMANEGAPIIFFMRSLYDDM